MYRQMTNVSVLTYFLCKCSCWIFLMDLLPTTPIWNSLMDWREGELVSEFKSIFNSVQLYFCSALQYLKNSYLRAVYLWSRSRLCSYYIASCPHWEQTVTKKTAFRQKTWADILWLWNQVVIQNKARARTWKEAWRYVLAMWYCVSLVLFE